MPRVDYLMMSFIKIRSPLCWTWEPFLYVLFSNNLKRMRLVYHLFIGLMNDFTGKCLYLSGLVPEPFTAEDDFSLLNYGLGFTNMVARPTKGSADLTRREIKQGSQILLEKLQKFRPKIAVFNGKLIYEVFSGKKDFPFGRQSEFVEGTNTVSVTYAE